MKKSSAPIIEESSQALSRIQSRILGVMDGYIIILRSIHIAWKSNNDLKRNIDSLEKNLSSSKMDVEHYFLSILFLDLISEFEIFLSHIIKAVIVKYPMKIGSASFKLNEIIDSVSIEELVTKAADEHLNKLMYKKPMEYLESICDLLSINKELLTNDWKVYVEAKARRDLGVHNSWVCNETYLRKLREADISSTAKIGESMFPTYNDYLKHNLKNLMGLTEKIVNEVIAKHNQETDAGTSTQNS